MKSVFENKTIEFEASGSQLLLSVDDELIKVIPVGDTLYSVNEFKTQSARMFKQDVKDVTFIM